MSLQSMKYLLEAFVIITDEQRETLKRKIKDKYPLMDTSIIKNYIDKNFIMEILECNDLQEILEG